MAFTGRICFTVTTSNPTGWVLFLFWTGRTVFFKQLQSIFGAYPVTLTHWSQWVLYHWRQRGWDFILCNLRWVKLNPHLPLEHFNECEKSSDLDKKFTAGIYLYNHLNKPLGLMKKLDLNHPSQIYMDVRVIKYIGTCHQLVHLFIQWPLSWCWKVPSGFSGTQIAFLKLIYIFKNA